MKSESYRCGRQPKRVNTLDGVFFCCPEGHYCTKAYPKPISVGNSSKAESNFSFHRYDKPFGCYGYWSPNAKECRIDSIEEKCKRFTEEKQALAEGVVLVDEERQEVLENDK